ncbi:hypothetical protein ABES38_17700 [Bacillus gobiensis]|uniref:hypothetical protein n=1 Tax=Bacillus gobiensis TaxID=1441095 RepID=UPI003D231BBC
MKKLRRISIFGIVMFILGIFISYLGVKEYQQQGLRINSSYALQHTLASASIKIQTADIQSLMANLKLENYANPTKNDEIKKNELKLRIQEMLIDKQSIEEELKIQKEQELHGRIYDLLTYLSLGITFFIFGLSLFWRKKDVMNAEEQHHTILSKYNQHSNQLRQIKEYLQAQTDERQHLNVVYNKQIQNNQILIDKLDTFLKEVNENKKQIAASKEEFNSTRQTGSSSLDG